MMYPEGFLDAFFDGMDANKLGKNLDDNPFPLGTSERRFWGNGWYFETTGNPLTIPSSKILETSPIGLCYVSRDEADDSVVDDGFNEK